MYDGCRTETITAPVLATGAFWFAFFKLCKRWCSCTNSFQPGWSWGNIMASSDGRSSRAWKALCARLRVELPPICWLCGGDIDLGLHHLDRWAWTLDHVQPLDTHPELAMDLANLRPAHRSCNSSKGSSTSTNAVRTSRTWC